MTLKERSAEGMCPHPNLSRTSARWSRRSAILLVAITAVSSAFAQGRSEEARRERPAPTQISLDPENPEYQITENGPHHRKWERVEKRVNEEGEEEEIVHRYTELGTGLNRWDEDRAEWVESSELIEAFEGGAIARGGQMKVIFSPTLGDPAGTVDILTAEGERMRTVALGLAYYDPVSGDDVILSEVNPNVEGEILPPNRVIYRDAFTDIHADIVYKYRRGGFSQNIVLHESPVSPEFLGLSNLTRLEVLSEVLEAPEIRKKVRVVKAYHTNAEARAQMAEPDLLDETIYLGETLIGQGKAFELGREETAGAVVTKRWNELDERTILFEGVEYEDAKKSLGKLPQKTFEGLRRRASVQSKEDNVKRLMPRRRMVRVGSNENSPLAIAKGRNDDLRGYLIDYEVVVGGATDFVFETGETYYVGGYLTIHGTTTFEGGAIIKHHTTGHLAMTGPIVCATNPYLPAIFTSRHDDTVGETISGSTGTPPAGPYVDLNPILLANGLENRFENIRVKYAETGFRVDGSGKIVVRNAQIIGCDYAVQSHSSDVVAENVLVSGGLKVFVGNSITGSHLTLDSVGELGGGASLDLKNSLIVNVPVIGSYVGKGAPHNIELAGASGAFQSAGGGHYYLASNSPYRDIGTSSINPDLLADLESRTTYPPIHLPNDYQISADSKWAPAVPRDTGPPDLGYHYAPLDYLMNRCVIGQGFTLEVKPGTAMAVYDVSQQSHGFLVEIDASLKLKGDVLNPVVLTVSETVQEEPGANSAIWTHYLISTEFQSDWTSYRDIVLENVLLSDVGSALGSWLDFRGGYNAPVGYSSSVVNCRLLNVRYYSSANVSNFWFVNNEVRNGSSGSYVGLFNSLTEEITHNLFDVNVANFSWFPSGALHHFVRENIFEGVDPFFARSSFATSSFFHYGYNAFHDSDPLLSFQTTDQFHSTPIIYESGPLGDYYISGTHPHVDAGSQTADLAGLYHFTTQTNQTIEGTSVVDIGLHYPVLDSNGQLLDSDQDGYPDIVEDRNGNGVADTGESDWQTSENGTTGVPGLTVFNLLD